MNVAIAWTPFCSGLVRAGLECKIPIINYLHLLAHSKYRLMLQIQSNSSSGPQGYSPISRTPWILPFPWSLPGCHNWSDDSTPIFSRTRGFPRILQNFSSSSLGSMVEEIDKVKKNSTCYQSPQFNIIARAAAHWPLRILSRSFHQVSWLSFTPCFTENGFLGQCFTLLFLVFSWILALLFPT